MPPDTILFVVRGMSLKTEFRVGIAQCPLTFGQDCKAIIAEDSVALPLYLANVLRAKRGEVLGLVDEASHGTGRLQTETLKSLLVPLPPLPEQRRIAAVLGALDDKIELNRKMNKTLEEMAQAIFKSWFIDFDGHTDLVDSELGPIPRGWRVSTLRKHIDLDKGLSYKGKYLTDSGTPMVNLKCVKAHGGFRREATKPYSGDYKPRHLVRPGDVVIANTDLTQARDILGCPAFVAAIPWADEIITSHHTFAVRFREDEALGKHFLYHLLLSPPARARCRGFATGTTVLAVPKDAILDLQFPLPSGSAAQRFEDISGLVHRRLETNEDQSDTLADLRDTLLPKLISGEIRVPEAVQLVEDQE